MVGMDGGGLAVHDGAGGLEPGAAVWVPLPGDTLGWVKARLVKKVEVKGPRGESTFDFTVEHSGEGDSGVERVIRSRRGKEGDFAEVKLANEELGQAGMEGEASAVDDLIRLTHLHEPSILHTLELRYWRDIIYTYTGPILLVVNPFKLLPLYTDEKLEAYKHAGHRFALKMSGGASAAGDRDDDQDGLPPHIFAVADKAYMAMTGPIAAQMGSANQSILVSGESGAGKTETSKHIMQYLAVISTGIKAAARLNGEVDETIANQVLQSNPILESFGNARTIRNDNSSRFGKFIELQFEHRAGRLCGASVVTYLLEKVRIVSQAERERNYHSFYELIKGADDHEREALGLGPPEKCSSFRYINQSGCYSRQDHVDDAVQYKRTRAAMSIMGFDEDEQCRVMKVVAAVLHLGNLRFSLTQHADPLAPDAAEVDEETADVAERVASLLEVDTQLFKNSLTTRNILAGREWLNVKLTPAQAEGARDAMAKAVYGGLFFWIVARVNAAISRRQQVNAQKGGQNNLITPIKTGHPATAADMFIGVLDIFGFESFRHNSMEQLLINYANETLQQQFNLFVFKLEQEEYEREAISWSFIEFPDNQECLELLENRSSGILALLDEQCVVPKATDHSFAGRLYDKCKDHPRFSVSARERVEFLFTIHHYAGPVTYDTTGFLDKNRDQLYQETIEVLQSSSCPVVQSLLQAPEADAAVPASPAAPPGGRSTPLTSPNHVRTLDRQASTGTPGSQMKRRSSVAPLTVGSQFRGQLAVLLTKIRSTRPHYVRCLKPNDQNVSSAFDQGRIIEQLRCGGVLEAVRVSRSGYPTRMLHVQFYQRYRPLALAEFDRAQRECRSHHITGREKERAVAEAVMRGLMSLLLERRRSDELVPMPAAEEWAALAFKEQLAHMGLQLGKTKAFFRLQAFEEAETQRGRRLMLASVRLQTVVRCWLRFRAYRRLQRSCLAAQRIVRGFVAKRRVERLRRKRAAIRLQTAVRCFMALRAYRQALARIVLLQRLHRGNLGRKEATRVREERASTDLQAWWRMVSSRKRFRHALEALVRIQSQFRRAVARMELRRLRIAARDLGNVVREKNALQQTVTELRQELQEVKSENERLKSKVERLEEAAARPLAEVSQTDESAEKAWPQMSLSVQKNEEALKAQTAELMSLREQLKTAQIVVRLHEVRVKEFQSAQERSLPSEQYMGEKEGSDVDGTRDQASAFDAADGVSEDDVNALLDEARAVIGKQQAEISQLRTKVDEAPQPQAVENGHVNGDDGMIAVADENARLREKVEVLERQMVEAALVARTAERELAAHKEVMESARAHSSEEGAGDDADAYRKLAVELQAKLSMAEDHVSDERERATRLNAEVTRLAEERCAARNAPSSSAAMPFGGHEPYSPLAAPADTAVSKDLEAYKQQVGELQAKLHAAEGRVRELSLIDASEVGRLKDEVTRLQQQLRDRASAASAGQASDVHAIPGAPSDGEADALAQEAMELQARLVAAESRIQQLSFTNEVVMSQPQVVPMEKSRRDVATSPIRPARRHVQLEQEEDDILDETEEPVGPRKPQGDTCGGFSLSSSYSSQHRPGSYHSCLDGYQSGGWSTQRDEQANGLTGADPSLEEVESVDDEPRLDGLYVRPSTYAASELSQLEDLRDGLSVSLASISSRFSNTVAVLPTRDLIHACARMEDNDAVLDMIRDRLTPLDEQVRLEVVNQQDREGRTPLHLAALRGSGRIVRLLLASGAGPNLYDCHNETPLHLSHDKDVIEALLEYSANPNLPNHKNETALHLAVKRRDVLALMALVKPGTATSKPLDLNATEDSNGYSPLHVAAETGWLDAVAILCHHGADVEAQDLRCRRPLHLCCGSSHLSDGAGILCKLLDHGADPNSVTGMGWTPLHYVCDNKSYSRYSLELVNMLELLLDRGAEVNKASQDGCTSLHLAAKHEARDLCTKLGSRGAQWTIPWKAQGLSPSLAPPPTPSRSGRVRSASGSSTSVSAPSAELYAVEMFKPELLQQMLSVGSSRQEAIKQASRGSCMRCSVMFSMINPSTHCKHCARILCTSCAASQLPKRLFPQGVQELEKREHLRVCEECHAALKARHQSFTESDVDPPADALSDSSSVY